MLKLGLRCSLAGFALSAALMSLGPASARTYYVRSDGGAAQQCDGTADAPASAAPHCAWAHPSIPLPLGDGDYGQVAPKALMKPGDTLSIGPGQYMIGIGAPGVGQSCVPSQAYECEISNIPSGTDALHPTTITGDCSGKTQLWATQRNGSIFRIEKAHDIKIACLELTDHSNCIESYRPTANTGVAPCDRKKYPFGTWGATGLYAASVTNLTLDRLNIHGFADYGVQAGRLAGNTTVSNTTIRANGWGGWNGDLGGNDHTSANAGTLRFDRLIVEWNGCAEAYPATTIVGCWGQEEGGYGDGFGEAWTGGDWIFTRADIHDNTQDGLDLLYNNGTGSTKVVQGRFHGNAGNQVKISGPSTILNSIIVGNCMWTQQKAGTTMLGMMQSGDDCRALGNAVEVDFPLSNQIATLAFNTITGQGDGLIDASQTAKGNNKVVLANNILDGRHSDKRGDEPTFGYYGGDDNPVAVGWIGNLVHGIRHGSCPGDSICSDPMLRDPAFAGYDPALRPGSPAIGAASPGVNIETDFRGMPRPRHASIGAVEYSPASDRVEPAH